MDFQFIGPKKIIFQLGSSSRIGEHLQSNKKFSTAKKPLLLTGSSSLVKSGHYKKILNSLKQQNYSVIEYQGIKGEPTPQSIDSITEFACHRQVDCIISIGGGSVIDTGKAVAALATNNKGVENYLEGVGKNYKIINDPLPFLSSPTTAGTGAEVTKNSVVRSFTKQYKKSFRDERLIADMVIIDPELTISLPQKTTVYSGMDAICQLIESFTTKKQNPFANALSSYYIPKAINAIKTVFDNPTNINARSIMSEASLASGLCLANSGLGAVHGFASGIGGLFDIDHGLICSVLLPGVCKINSNENNSPYKKLARLITPDHSDDINKMINILYDLNKYLQIPSNFKSYNIDKNQAQIIVDKSQGSSMRGNSSQIDRQKWIEFIYDFL